jgi:hypothetical protein
MSVAPIPSNPFHIARAYGVQPPRPVAPARDVPATAAPTATAPLSFGASRTPRPATSPLAAGVVPGRISFTGSAPTDAAAALPLYRHPADKNAVATALSAGRLVDLEG